MTGRATAWNGRVAWLLAELVVVTTGVLLALAADSWRTARAERALERAALARVRHDVAQIENGAEYFRIWMDSVASAARQTLALLETGRPLDDVAATLALMHRATFSEDLTYAARLPDAAYRELMATGRLSLIRAVSVRTQLIRLYTFAAASRELVAAHRTGFREFVLGRLPLAMRAVLDERCSTMRVPIGSCSGFVDDLDAATAIVRTAMATPALVAELRLLVPQVERASRVSRSLVDMARALARTLDAAPERCGDTTDSVAQC